MRRSWALRRNVLARALALVTSVAGLLCVLPSCTKSPRIVERQVFVYSTRNCPVSSEAYSVIYASGDFEPSLDQPPASSAFLKDVGYVMNELPDLTRALLVDVSQRDVDVDWRGFSDITSPSGPINVLVWPGGTSCRLTEDVERRDRAAFGVAGHHVMIAGGRSLDLLAVPHTYVADLTTGAIVQLPIGLNTRRAFATATAFGALGSSDDPTPILVAGGEDPDFGFANSSAEVYEPAPGAPGDIGDFDSTPIGLSEARSRHGAVVLVTGETLLVGGRNGAHVLPSMEMIDPVKRKTKSGGLALLQVPRERPTVLRLASGEIMVAGGFDENGAPVPTIEWFAPDASHRTKTPTDLVVGKVIKDGDLSIEERAFVPLEAGGALAVIMPADATATDFKTVWVISAEGVIEPGIPVDPTTLKTVRLYRGAEGAPALWTGERWMRWQPWFGGFETIADGPTLASCINQATGQTVCSSGPTLSAITSGDSGLALWLDDRGLGGMTITGYRFDTRTRYGAVPKPLLLAGPDQLAPDRLAGFPGSVLQFDTDRGLTLGPKASAFLTDVTFADFDAEFDVTAGAPSVILRQDDGTELDIGGIDCAIAQEATKHIAVRRRGARVLVTVDATPERECPKQFANGGVRVSIGLRGSQGAGVSGARNLRVTRH